MVKNALCMLRRAARLLLELFVGHQRHLWQVVRLLLALIFQSFLINIVADPSNFGTVMYLLMYSS